MDARGMIAVYVVGVLGVVFCEDVCEIEHSVSIKDDEQPKWVASKVGAVVISDPPCLDNHGKYILRECGNNGWCPKQPPLCNSAVASTICPDGFMEFNNNCLKVTQLKNFDELCEYPGVRFYNYSKINSTGTSLWMPIRKINSTFIYTSIDRRYGMEFKMEDQNTTQGCFIKTSNEVNPSDCNDLHHHVCMYRGSYFSNRNMLLQNDSDYETTVRLVLKYDKKREKLLLKVYTPEELMLTADDHGYAVYCFTDASVNEMKTKVKKKLIFNSLTERKKQPNNLLVYQIPLKHQYAGQYWCEAYDLKESLIKSNTLIAAKRKKGNEYSVRLLLKHICDAGSDCSVITTDLIYKYLDQYNFKGSLKGIDCIIRVMYIYERLVDNDVDVLLHLSTQRQANVIGEYHRILRLLYTQLDPNISLENFKSSEVCLPERTDNLNWKLTVMGNQATPREFCVGSNGFPVVRMCDGDFLEGAFWGDFAPCDNSIKITPKTRLLYNLSISNETYRTVEAVKNLTTEAEDLSSLDVYYIANTLNNISSISGDEIFEDLVETLEHILRSRAEVLKESQLHLNATDVILDSIDIFLRDEALLNRLESDVFMVNKSKVIVHITKPFLSNVTGIAVYDNGNNEYDSGEVVNMMMNETFTDLEMDGLDISVYIPTELLESIVEDDDVRENLTVITTVFYNDKLFNSVDNVTTSGRVVSVTIPDYGIFLKEPIPLLFRNKEGVDYNAACTFWEYGVNSPDKTGHWSSSGGNYVGVKHDNYSECAFTHLTHFALLILSQKMIVNEDLNEISEFDDFYGQLERHHTALSIITFVGCSLSLAGLAGIFLTAICFRRWRIKVGSKILLQLSITISLELIVVHVAGSDYLPDKTTACNLVGMSLQYVVLAKFSWMFVSAILQYIRFVKVLSVLPPRLVLKTMAFGWCAPLIPVIFVASFWPNNYSQGSQKFCYPTGTGLYLGLFGPVVLIVIANLIVFTLIMQNVLRSKIEGQPRAKKSQKLQIYLGILLFFMLGMPWVFGILAEILNNSSFQLVFVYLFCLTATLQGCVLFVFYVLLNKDTRNLWLFALGDRHSLSKQ